MKRLRRQDTRPVLTTVEMKTTLAMFQHEN